MLSESLSECGDSEGMRLLQAFHALNCSWELFQETQNG